MRKGCPRLIQPMWLVWMSLCLATAFIGVRCWETTEIPVSAGPGFVMPAVGDATDTVLRIGDRFPQLPAVDLEGKAVTFDKQLLGDRYTLIVFWSTWCGFCMLELPHEVELANRYEHLGLRVIGVNADDTTAIAKAAVTKHHVPWINVFEGPDKTISNTLGIKQWPALLLLDSEGKVVSTTTELRSISVETLSDGSDRQINGLEWTLRELLGTN